MMLFKKFRTVLIKALLMSALMLSGLMVWTQASARSYCQ
jgi:hypothetical protein